MRYEALDGKVLTEAYADVMDYSLVVGVDAVKSELVVGIVGTSRTSPLPR